MLTPANLGEIASPLRGGCTKTDSVICPGVLSSPPDLRTDNRILISINDPLYVAGENGGVM
jgi:hypothetical protein